MLTDSIKTNWRLSNEGFWRKQVDAIKRSISKVDNIDDKKAECDNAEWRNVLTCSAKCEEEYPATMAD